MKAIILAAGMGSRLKDLTKDNTKCMVKVNGKSLIERALSQLDKFNLEEIILVVGYKKEVLKEYIKDLNIKTKISFIDNDIYDKTNNIYSLYMTKDIMLNNDIVLLESDLIFDKEILERLINNECPNMAVVDKYELWMDGTCVKLNEKEDITEIVSSKRFDFSKTHDLYKTVNIYKFSKEFNKKYYIPFLEAYIQSQGLNQYYESVLETLVNIAPTSLKGLVVKNEKWYEIDDKQDLDIAESLFTSPKEKLKRLQSRYGGYWRYPKLKDFCYLVNPYFPTPKMIDEMKRNFEVLLRQYPSGLRVNNFIASKYFSLNEDYVLVGNGAAELIKAVMQNVKGKIGVIRPTFEEYPNRYDEQNIEPFMVETKDFKYDVQDIIAFFNDKTIQNLVLINPDNPSGNYIPKKDVFSLLEWAEKKNILIILDESFVDFAKENDSSFLTNEILEKYKNLVVIKSISKSYGVPGVRLGVVATSNTSFINSLKKDISIWNINSFGEYYMQIFGKYEKTYKASLNKIKAARDLFIDELKKIKEIEVYDSDANYILVKILEKYDSTQLTEILLDKYNIFIKDLKSKKGINKNYLRIAVRDIDDNTALVEALKEIYAKEIK